MFRAQLILHNKVREVFEQSLRLAREAGYLKPGRGMRVALDTTYILGRGAVKDTYNLLADVIMKLMWALATVENIPVRQWAEAHGYLRYAGSSVKGDAAIDWSDRRARQKLLGEICRRRPVAGIGATGPVRAAHRQWGAGGGSGRGGVAGTIAAPGREGSGDGVGDADDADGEVTIRDGVSKDRILSVHDPEMRHGHKSSRRRFDGHKAAVVVDTGPS